MPIIKFKLLLITLTLCATPVLAKELDRVYAIVNDEIITKSEFKLEALNTEAEMQSRGTQIPDRKALNRQVLDRMISERLQLQIADRAGIVIPEPQLDEVVKEIAERNNMSLPQLKSALANDNVPYSTFTKRIEDQLRIQQIIERQINSRVVVSDQEVDEFLRSESLGSGVNSEFNISHIIVPIADVNRGLDNARNIIDKAKQAIDNGMSFATAAAQFSAYQDALKGGEIGWRKSGELPTLYYQAARSLQVGEVSKVLQSESALHIIKLNDLRTTTDTSDEQITQWRVRQILLRFSPSNSPEYLRIRLNEIAKQLNNGEDFGALALQYSEDPQSRIKGGDLGWNSPGELSAQAEQALSNLSNGQISDPVQSLEGISIFQVIDRRQRAAGNRLQKNAAREQIHQRKAEQLYQDWLQQLRDQAYIEYLIDDMG